MNREQKKSKEQKNGVREGQRLVYRMIGSESDRYKMRIRAKEKNTLCVSVCKRERERETDRQTDRHRDRDRKNE